MIKITIVIMILMQLIGKIAIILILFIHFLFIYFFFSWNFVSSNIPIPPKRLQKYLK